MNYGLRIKSLREKNGDTQEDLANKLGISRCYVAMMERGTKPVSLPIADAVATLYGVTLDDLRE